MRDLLDCVHGVISDTAMLHGEVTNMRRAQEDMREELAEMKKYVDAMMSDSSAVTALLRGAHP